MKFISKELTVILGIGSVLNKILFAENMRVCEGRENSISQVGGTSMVRTGSVERKSPKIMKNEARPTADTETFVEITNIRRGKQGEHSYRDENRSRALVDSRYWDWCDRWRLLPGEVSTAARTLAYSAVTWRSPGTASVESKAWDELSATEQQAATVLGYDWASWDCRVNHYESYSWDELAEVGVQEFFLALGYNAANWEDGSGPKNPDSDDYDYDELDDDSDFPGMKEAADAICYNAFIWDNYGTKIDSSSPNNNCATTTNSNMCPTPAPSHDPSSAPSSDPSEHPTKTPSARPTSVPSGAPSDVPNTTPRPEP